MWPAPKLRQKCSVHWNEPLLPYHIRGRDGRILAVVVTEMSLADTLAWSRKAALESRQYTASYLKL